MMNSPLSWLTLKSVPGVGNHLFKRLIDAFQEPARVFRASPSELEKIKGISQKTAGVIKSWKIPEKVRADLALALRKGYRIVTLSDPEYPELLRQLPDPPPVLYVYGNLDNSRDHLAVVGSRSATPYGIQNAKALSRSLSRERITIVSGMARGIDTAAHQGALAGGGKTIAVLGSGLGVVYPPENKRLYHKIAENGAVISEFPVMTPPDPHNFPLRNRIICGISIGTLVVEAAKKSGSLITARLANEQGREVFAVPGNIGSFKSTGTHSLLKQGAKLVENIQDILEEFKYTLKHPAGSAPEGAHKKGLRNPAANLDNMEQRVFESLGTYPVHIDLLQRKLNIKSGLLSGILLQLELKGLVKQTPGKLFSISEE